ncbi:conjugal transfer protein TraD [Mesorhizobium sp. 131-3-5]|uniref:conjugal transfer protein TraD n=1 Tax=Mesorhizobium sp. 131-3-5 TaxID=2744520 RepID=UPI001FD26C03|nr:conjugal transfer protein TraD [Mesorhizobium sp. 131-3-5]
MRTWQVERRKRTRHLIELGGLVVKAGIVDLTKYDRATIYGALLTGDNATLTSELQTAQTDLAASQAQVADLVAKSNANNDALAAVLAPANPPQQ